jgi:hypothetical protein
MEEQNGSQAQEPDPRIAELEAKLANVSRDYAASSREAKRLAELNQNLQSAYVNPHQDVPHRNTAGERLAEAAVPVDALEEYVDQRANQIVSQKFEPLVRGMQARQTMLGKYKDYGKFESDIGELLNTDSDFQQMYNRVFQADPVAAFELAYHRLGETKRKSHRNGAPPDTSDLTEAQIPNQRSGDARRIPQGQEAAVEVAARNYRENPNRNTAAAFARARLKTAISDDFLNQ